MSRQAARRAAQLARKGADSNQQLEHSRQLLAANLEQMKQQANSHLVTAQALGHRAQSLSIEMTKCHAAAALASGGRFLIPDDIEEQMKGKQLAFERTSDGILVMVKDAPDPEPEKIEDAPPAPLPDMDDVNARLKKAAEASD